MGSIYRHKRDKRLAVTFTIKTQSNTVPKLPKEYFNHLKHSHVKFGFGYLQITYTEHKKTTDQDLQIIYDYMRFLLET